VLFIAIDDLNDWITPLGGHPQAYTPNLAALARRSVSFSRAYCSAPACNPSRASLLTGRRPSSSGVYYNASNWRAASGDAITLPRLFRDHGYHVAGGGKLFHGGQNDESAWDEYLPLPSSPTPEGRPLNGIPGTRHFDWGPVHVAREDMGDWALVEWGARQLHTLSRGAVGGVEPASPHDVRPRQSLLAVRAVALHPVRRWR
jgi:arylsulfatase A-like enzyme